MKETEALGYLIQRQRVTAPELARRFDDDVLAVHQAFSRLERKGLVRRRKKRYNRVEFELTKRAKDLSQQVKNNDRELGFIIFLGIAVLILLLASES